MNEIDIEVFDSFLPKAEFNKLSDSQKVDYYFNFSDWFEGVIESADPGDYGFPELFEGFCKDIYPETWKELLSQLDIDAFEDAGEALNCTVLEILKRNKVANKDIVLYIANATYDNDIFYSAAVAANNLKPAERDEGDLPLFFEYDEELETGYIGGPHIAKIADASAVIKIGKNKAERLQHLRGTLGIIQLKQYAQYWDEKSVDSNCLSIEGYDCLCKHIASYFRGEISDSQFMYKFCEFVPEAMAREAWRDIQKQIDDASLLQWNILGIFAGKNPTNDISKFRLKYKAKYLPCISK